MRVLYFAWRADRLTRGRFDIVHSHMNGWAGEIQVMHVTPVRYNRLTRAKPLKRLTAWLSPGWRPTCCSRNRACVRRPSAAWWPCPG